MVSMHAVAPPLIMSHIHSQKRGTHFFFSSAAAIGMVLLLLLLLLLACGLGRCPRKRKEH